ncbi:unnamed protein product, partial [Rotaria sp. Silwood1]
MYSCVGTGKSNIMIVHGGISTRIDLQQINSLERNRYISMIILPNSKYVGECLTKDEQEEYLQVVDLLWSDPDPENCSGCRNNDNRCIGCFFGSDVTEEFLSENNFSMIIRSHQVKERGYDFDHNGNVLTIFSASNYCDGSNYGAFARWDYMAEGPEMTSFTLQDMNPNEQLSFNKKVTLFEDPVYQTLMKKIVAKKSLLKKEFEKADKNQTEYLSPTVWSDIMKNILQIDLPWLTLRSKFVREDAQGVLYNTTIEDYALHNTKFQKTHTGIMEDLYMWKDTLMTLFNLIDSDHSGFISRDEFCDVLKLIFYGENGNNDVSQTYIEEVISAMDFDKDGKIDVNEFL